MTQEIAIGVDIGGTKIAFAVVDRAGEVLLQHRLATPVEAGPDGVFAQVAAGIHHLLDQVGQPVAGVGIGSPGHMNPREGLIYKATNLGWDHVNLLDGVRKHLRQEMPLWLEKDANAAALAEWIFGAAQGYADFALITIGTGLGGGAMSGGQLVAGAHDSGMEIGHMPLDANGRMCVCGMKGCPEMYVSGVGLLSGVRAYRDAYPQSPLAQSDPITTEAILAAFTAGDPLAVRVLDECSDWLCSVMIACMGILNPGLFVIGGGLGHALYDYLAHDTREKLKNRTRREIHQTVPIAESQVKHSAIGAACLVWHGLANEK